MNIWNEFLSISLLDCDTLSTGSCWRNMSVAWGIVVRLSKISLRGSILRLLTLVTIVRLLRWVVAIAWRWCSSQRPVAAHKILVNSLLINELSTDLLLEQFHFLVHSLSHSFLNYFLNTCSQVFWNAVQVIFSDGAD